MATPGPSRDWPSAGPLFMVGIPGPRLDEAARELVRELRVGGVILFSRNIETPEQVWELTRDLQQEARARGDLPLLIAVDQEGGVVQRLTGPFTRIPAARDLGNNATPAEVAALSRTVARELALVGVNLNLAPVLDVARSPACPQWRRSYSSDPEQVARFGAAAIRGFLEGGILPAAKHFPGLGDTSVDSHQVLPTAQDPDAARPGHLLPFRQAVAAGVPVIMTAHVHVPAWDSQPATLSAVALSDWLRGNLGFRGVIITDDLEMGAIAGATAVPAAACQALMAGADLLLICSEGKAVWEAAALLQSDHSLQQRLAEAQNRLEHLRKQIARKPADLEKVKAYFKGRG
jgi:beta-N-acetylhexosaminidase